MSILADVNRKDYQPRHGKAAIERSAALSMANTPKDSAHTRKVAILAAAGVDASAVEIMKRHEPKPKEQLPSSGPGVGQRDATRAVGIDQGPLGKRHPAG